MPEYNEGQTATNPATGARLVYRGGSWGPLTSGGDSQPKPWEMDWSGKSSGAAGRPGTLGGMTPDGESLDRIRKRAQGIMVMSAKDDPFATITDPKARAQAQKSILMDAAKAQTKAQPDIDRARTMEGNLQEFDHLNDTIRPTGDILNKAANWVGASLGNSDLDRMHELSANMGRNMRQAGEGAVSDYEGKLFQSMVGGYDKPYASNQAFSAAGHALAKRQVEMHQFRDDYLSANGTLVGSDKLWQRYRDANPLLDKSGKPISKVPTYKEYYAKRAQGYLEKAYPKPRTAPPSTRKPASASGWVMKEIQ